MIYDKYIKSLILKIKNYDIKDNSPTIKKRKIKQKFSKQKY